jgi:hypothetical protein
VTDTREHASRARLLLHEATQPNGQLETSWLELAGDELALRSGDAEPLAVPLRVLAGVMRRYGRPLADETSLTGPELLLPSGERLTLLRHLARFDVVAKDYLVFEAPGDAPLAELATAVTAALSFVAKRMAPSER